MKPYFGVHITNERFLFFLLLIINILIPVFQDSNVTWQSTKGKAKQDFDFRMNENINK